MVEPSPPDLPGQHLIQRCVIIQRNEKGYGLTVTGDNPVFVQSVKDDGAAQKAGVQVGDRIIKVNGTVVTLYNHIEVVNLIKSGSYVALTLLGKPPSSQNGPPPASSGSPTHASQENQGSMSPPPRRDTGRDERIMAIERVLQQERQFYERTVDDYLKRPSEKLQKELLESKTRISAFEAELNALANPQHKVNYPVPPKSAPPGRVDLPSWSSAGSYSAGSEDQAELNFTNAASEGSRDPPPPPDRKHLPSKGDQLHKDIARVNSFGGTRNKFGVVPNGSGHIRQHSSPDQFFIPAGGSFKKKASDKRSFEDMTGQSGAPYSGLPPASPATTRRMLLGNSWSDKRGASEDLGTRPSSSDLYDKRSRSGTTGSMEDDDTFAPDPSRLGIPHHQSQLSIMSADGDEFSDEEKVEDHGPFNDMNLLKNKPAHLAVFLHYLISNSDPSSLLFWVVTDSYKEGTSKEMRKWAYEIYSTFLAKSAPLEVSLPEEIRSQIEDVFDGVYSEECLRNLFSPARESAAELIKELLADFRSKRALGLGSLFGDHQLTDDNMDKNEELHVVEQTLTPHLENFMQEINTPDNPNSDRSSAMASALMTFMKQVGVSIKANANMLERCSSFTQKENKSLFKIKGNKKTKGHHFVSQHYTNVTFCSHCGGLLWGIGDQGYQCSICEFNVHKGNCFDSIEENCPGTKKKKRINHPERSASIISRINPRKPSTIAQPLDQRQAKTDEDDSEDDEKTDDTLSSGKESSLRPFDVDAGSESDRSFHGLSEDTLKPRMGSTIELYPNRMIKDKSSIMRSSSLRSPRDLVVRKKAMGGKGRRSVAGLQDAPDPADLDIASNSPLSLDTVSEDDEDLDSDMEVEEQLQPWQQMVEKKDKKIIKKLKTKEIKRQEVIHELIHTEKTHLKKLKVLRMVFYKPMIKLNIMPYSEIKLLFPNLDELIEISVNLKNDMKKRQEEEEVITCIGDVMLKRFDDDEGQKAKEAFARFCNNQKLALDNVKQKQRKDPKVAQFIQGCESNRFCCRQDLQGIVSSSFQRLTKYPLLLERIKGNTPSSHPDFKNLERAINCTKDMLAYVNQSIKESEDYQKLLDFNRRIDKKQMEGNIKNLDLQNKKLVYDGPLTWRINRAKSIDLHVLLLEDLLVLLQKQDDKLLLKGTTVSSSSAADSKTAHSPVIKLNTVLARNVATDKRAFFLVSTSALGPQIYELVATSSNERQTWYKHITDTAEAYKGRERGRRGGVSIGGTGGISPEIRLRSASDIPVANHVTDLEEAKVREKEKRLNAAESKKNAEVNEKSDDGDKKDMNLILPQIVTPANKRNHEGEVQQQPEPEPEPAPEVESDQEDEPELEAGDEEDEDDEVEDARSKVRSAAGSGPTLNPEPPVAMRPEPEVPSLEPPLPQLHATYTVRSHLPELINEEGVDDRNQALDSASIISESSSSSNDTLKMRNSLSQLSTDDPDDSLSSGSGKSPVAMIASLRAKDEELRRALEEKAAIVAELRGAAVTSGSSTSESHVSGDSMEARDLILSAILQANRLTVAVSDVLNPHLMLEDAPGSRASLTQNSIDPESLFSPQQQLVSSTSILNEQLTTLLGVITERDMARERLRCDLQFANSQIQRLKQGRPTRRLRDVSNPDHSATDDYMSGFNTDSPRPGSPTSTIDLESDYAALSETSDYMASEDNMDSISRSSSFSSYRDRNSLASSGYRSSTPPHSRHSSSRLRDESTHAPWWRSGNRHSGSHVNTNMANHLLRHIPNRAYWSDDGADYESQY